MGHGPRVNLADKAPAVYRAWLSVEQFLHDSTLPDNLLHLVKLRVSQINGCAFCVDMHARDARKAGETDQRLDAVAVWREAPFFTDAERAAFALAEASARLADNPAGVPDDVWQEAARHYDEQQLAVLVVALAQISAWNTVNVTLRHPPAAAAA
ncbi:carboxymuconolactone decarboxylase family protein [Streptomyces sp. 7-21]|uniref:carboxymuconolactone decarboxylase family protein n=1 Tax=Streptomyces sp. 7-21 TaxID=2802283 RepID=UPI00191F97A6|nr:carboxymuconolactone decarboxylase family protein [Streptomyces sp. 7-21]MBL1065691.1 carboxymuconolactone decarboxylase family protein [Streptomyces sp. 7-21]